MLSALWHHSATRLASQRSAREIRSSFARASSGIVFLNFLFVPQIRIVLQRMKQGIYKRKIQRGGPARATFLIEARSARACNAPSNAWAVPARRQSERKALLFLSLTLPSSFMPRATPRFLSLASRTPFSLSVTLGCLLAGKNSANWSVACSR